MYMNGHWIDRRTCRNGEPFSVTRRNTTISDRIIFGNTQAFHVVDPLDPDASKSVLIDWDLAQGELNEAMGLAVTLKVDEEVAKKKAELDAQLKVS